MKKRDSEVISTTSSTSKGSERRKNARFSLRRIFYTARSGRTKSRSSLDSDSSAKSEISLNVASERENGLSHTAAGAARASSFTNVQIPVRRLTEESSSETDLRECPLCLTECPLDQFPEISTCHHRSCLNCLQMYLRIEITESRINIACPECAEKFHPNDIQSILQNEGLMQKYEDFMVRRVLVGDADTRWCPAPDCGFAVIATGCAGCPKLKCERPGCGTYFCYHCKQYWHPNKTCDAARAERAGNIRSGSVTYSSHDPETQSEIKPCPRCSAFIMKMNDGSCNHMTCPVCGAEFCWLCMKEISDLHYLSPSGCTFWGKKPWSRKKKILWQLGTLVGAPVGITLVAGIAVPAMIIGIPVWVGRKIHSKYEMSSKHKRNLAITGGVAASVLISPVIAGLAVGIGVPILLGYVYGVVPISLCRSGGCGVTTTNSGGVRFEFDEENGGPAGSYAVDSQSVGTGHHVPNPSIAPSIGEASVGMTNSLYSASGSHMDRIGIIRDESDRDSSSNRAMAGSSLNGSICGSAYAACLGFQSKLEVQADVASTNENGKRASFSSESANFSIGEKSIGEKSGTVSYGDDASTKALAGSIVSYRIETASVTTASDVQMDLHSQHSRKRHNSIESNTMLPGDDKKKIASCPGSPTSGCSCVGEPEDGKHVCNGTKCRRCRRIARTPGEKGSEHMNVHFSDQVSLQSFQADDFVSELPSGKHCIDTLSDSCNLPVDGATNDTSNLEMLSESLPVLNTQQAGRSLSCPLTEVENDRPTFKSDSDRISNGEGTSHFLEAPSLTCGSMTKSRSEEICRTDSREGGRVGRIRHHSCELAINNGRISPATLQQSQIN